LAQQALRAAADDNVDVELAAGDVLEVAEADQEALELARERAARQVADHPDDAVAARAAKILDTALQVGYGGQ
jgi:hypothetical protein